ncbi:MAG: hypothetical protein PUG48_04305 [Clostridia bacterium]|nr:hypothetical protein [Clostridia bacterium]
MTKITNLMKSVRLELKSEKAYVFLGALLLTAMLASAIFIAFISNNIMSVFASYANSICPNGISVKISGLTYDNVDMLNDINFKEVYVDSPVYVDSADFYFGDKVLDECSVGAYYFRDENNNITEGKGYSQKNNVSSDGKIPMWISEDTGKKYGIKVGDEIKQIISDELTVSYYVEGIYNSDKFMIDDIGIPFTAYYQAMSDVGRFVQHNICGVIGDAKDYSFICNQVSQKGLTAGSSFDDVFNVLNMLRGLFFILSLFVTVIAAITFSNICNVIFKHRMKHIMLEKILGRKNRDTMFIYGFIIELTIIISLIAATVAVLCLQGYAETVITNTFGIKIANLTGITAYLPVAFILCNIVLIRSFVSVFKITRRSDIISVFEDRE